MTTDTLVLPERKRWTISFDRPLVLIVAALLILGLAMVYSTTFDWSAQKFGSPLSIWSKQVTWAGIGLLSMLVVYRVDTRFWHRISIGLMGVTAVLLVLVLVINHVVFGASRTLIGASFQPSELAKLVTIIYLADWLSSKGKKLRDIHYGLIPFAIVVGLIAGLIVLQPDLSMSIVIVLIALTMFFVAGADLLQFALGIIASGGIFVIVVPHFAHAQARLKAYMDALNDPNLASWHMRQVLVAIGSGGVMGKGLGASVQKFGNLPTPHTDSVFAVIGEELGLVGCAIVVILFAALAYRGFYIASRAQDEFSGLLATGVTCSILYEGIVNISVMTGLVPFTGLPLPFISYGGSSLITALTGVGILLSISRASNEGRGRPSRPSSTGEKARARDDRGRRDGGTRVPRFGRR